jgi:hypothetical protein
MATAPSVLATMVTTTSYGSWLPGDARGYIEEGQILPSDPVRLQTAKTRLAREPIHFSPEQRLCLFGALLHAADEFGYHLTDVSVESWHLHWIVEHGFDPVKVMVGRLKTRMRQALGIGRIWTEGYCHVCLYDLRAMELRRAYIARHRGCYMTAGRVLRATT